MDQLVLQEDGRSKSAIESQKRRDLKKQGKPPKPPPKTSAERKAAFNERKRMKKVLNVQTCQPPSSDELMHWGFAVQSELRFLSCAGS